MEQTMAENMSLMQFIHELLTNADFRNWFAAEPQAALHEVGLKDVSPHDVQDALTLVQDDSQNADFSRHYDTGDNHIGGGHIGGGHGEHHNAPAPVGHESAAEYVSRYITNNYIDDRDTTVDNSTNQQIDTHGGNFDQNIDVHSTVTTGDHNQVGNGNISGNGNVVGDGNHAVTGDGNTTAFGSGNATSTDVHGNVNVGDGGAFASGGNAAVDNSDNSLHNVGNTSTDNSINDSFKDSSDHSVHDSGNTSLDASQHDSNNTESHTDTSTTIHNETDNHVEANTEQHNVDNIHA